MVTERLVVPAYPGCSGIEANLSHVIEVVRQLFMIVCSYDADLQVSDTCVRNSLLS